MKNLQLILASAGFVLAKSADKSVNIQEVVDITRGVIDGALDIAKMPDIEKCVHDDEQVIVDAENAYNHFKSGDLEDVAKGFEDVSTAISQIKTSMQACSQTKADWDKLDKIAAMFKDPKSLVWHMGKDIWFNGMDITHRIATAITDYEASKWEDFGYQIGAVASEVLVGTQKRDAAKFFKGTLEPFGLKINVQDLLMCIHDEDQALLMVDAAVQSFEEAYEKKDIQGAIGGVIAVVGAYQQFKQGLPVCEAVMKKDFQIKEFEDSLDIAINPMKHFTLLEDDLLMHGVSILEDIGTGVKAYRNDDMETFGREMGKIIKLSTSSNALEAPKQKGWKDVYPKDNREMITEVAQGFLQGTKVGSFNFTNLLMCIYEADGAALDLYESVEILENAWAKKDWQDAVGGVMGLAAFAQAVEQTLPVCESVAMNNKDWSNVDNIIKLSKSDKHILDVVGTNMLINGYTITGEFIHAMEAWDKKDYKKFGFELGEGLTKATSEKNLFLY